jgi:hypothetical protein
MRGFRVFAAEKRSDFEAKNELNRAENREILRKNVVSQFPPSGELSPAARRPGGLS